MKNCVLNLKDHINDLKISMPRLQQFHDIVEEKLTVKEFLNTVIITNAITASLIFIHEQEEMNRELKPLNDEYSNSCFDIYTFFIQIQCMENCEPRYIYRSHFKTIQDDTILQRHIELSYPSTAHRIN